MSKYGDRTSSSPTISSMAVFQRNGNYEEDLEEKFLDLKEQNLSLKKEAQNANYQIKCLNTKLTRLLNEKKRLLKNTKTSREVELEENLFDMNSRLDQLSRENQRLRENLLVVQTQMSTLTSYPKLPYAHIKPRVDTGLGVSRGVRSLSANPLIHRKSASTLSLNRVTFTTNSHHVTSSSTASGGDRPLTARGVRITSNRSRGRFDPYPDSIPFNLLVETRNEIRRLEDVISGQQQHHFMATHHPSHHPSRPEDDDDHPSDANNYCIEGMKERTTNGVVHENKSIVNNNHPPHHQLHNTTHSNNGRKNEDMNQKVDEGLKRRASGDNLNTKQKRESKGKTASSSSASLSPSQSSASCQPPTGSNMEKKKVKTDVEAHLTLDLVNWGGQVSEKMVNYMEKMEDELRIEKERNSSLQIKMLTEMTSGRKLIDLKKRISDLEKENHILQDSLEKLLLHQDDSNTPPADPRMKSLEGNHQLVTPSSSHDYSHLEKLITRIKDLEVEKGVLKIELNTQYENRNKMQDETQRLMSELSQVKQMLEQKETSGEEDNECHRKDHLDLEDRLVLMERERNEFLNEFTEMKKMLEMIQESIQHESEDP